MHFKSTHIFYPLTQRLSHQNDIIFTKVHHIIDHSNVFLVLDIPNYLSSRKGENHEDWGMDIFQAMFTSSLHFIEYGNITIWTLRPLLRAKGHNFSYNNNHTFLTCPVKFSYTISIPVSSNPICLTAKQTNWPMATSFWVSLILDHISQKKVIDLCLFCFYIFDQCITRLFVTHWTNCM